MRVHVYDEEITGEVGVVHKTAAPGLTFTGVRMYLASHPVLHNTPQDDDRSAVTLWWENGQTEQAGTLLDVLRAMAAAIVQVEGQVAPGPLGSRPPDPHMEAAIAQAAPAPEAVAAPGILPDTSQPNGGATPTPG